MLRDGGILSVIIIQRAFSLRVSGALQMMSCDINDVPSRGCVMFYLLAARSRTLDDPQRRCGDRTVNAHVTNT